jgi:hypothetical protein
MKTPVRLLSVVALSVIATLLLAACGSDDPTVTPTSAPPTATPTATLAPGLPTPTPAPATPTPAPTPTPSFDGDAYFTGKTIKMITGTNPGGGYDTMLRIFGKVAPKHFPEGTRFVVQNIPGAAQLRGLKEVLKADPDGLTIGPTHQRWFIQEGLYGDVEGLDFETIEVVGSPTFVASPSLLCVDTSVATSWQDALDRGVQLVTGMPGPGNQPGPEFAELIGGPIRNVYGYGGSAESLAAFDRGEINAVWGCGPELAGRLYPEWIEQGRLAPLFWWEAESNEAWLASMGSSRAEVPHIFDIEGLNWTDLNKQAFDAYVTIALISRTFVLPSGVDPDVVSYWRTKFRDVVEDPDFIEGAAIAGYGDEYGYAGGPEIKDALLAMGSLPQEIKDILKNFAPTQ